MRDKIFDFLESKFSDSSKELSEISKDDKNNIVSTIKERAFSYDDIVKCHCKNGTSKINYCTPDAMLINREKNCITFIEFKNREMKIHKTEKIKCSLNPANCECIGENTKRKMVELHNSEISYGVRLKALEGLIALSKILINEGIISSKYDLELIEFKYILVYSAIKNSTLVDVRKGIENHKHRNRYTEYKVICQLDRYENILYSKVLTLDSEQFDSNYLKFIS